MLTLVFGHTVYSVSLTLSAFMAGLGFGAYLWGQSIDKSSRPLLIYAKIEIALAVLCIPISSLIEKLGPTYASISVLVENIFLPTELVKGFLAFTLMFFPAILMGATLPIISKYYVKHDSQLGSQVGLLYAFNTLGAAIGCALTGFILISALGVLQTTWFAAGINLLVGIGAIRVFQETETEMDWSLPWPALPKWERNDEGKIWLAISFICGFTALAYEVLWTRLLVFSIASTIYSFSMMLIVFLLGIMIGSLLVIPALKICTKPRTLILIFQALVGIYIVCSLFSLDSILSAPWNSYNLQEPLNTFFKYFKNCASLMLPPTIFLGMCFPLLIRSVTHSPSGIGGGSGQIYASNTLGGIAGSLTGGFLLIPMLGSLKSLILVATFNLTCSIWLFASGNYLTTAVRKVVTTVFALFTAGLFFFVPENLMDKFFMRDSTGTRDAGKLLYFKEGITNTIAVFKDNYGPLDPDAKRLITNGVSMSASNLIASRYMKLLAHLPILLKDESKDILVICFGTGQTVGAAGVHPNISRVDAVDLSPEVIDSGKVFSEENYDALKNPKIHITLQDGRNYLLTTPRLYDVVTSEPPPPRTAFTVNLYTREYYELTKSVLKPGGLAAQWIPLHSQSEEEVYRHFRTFREAFPHAMAWMPVANEIILIGSERPIVPDFKKLRDKMETPEIKQALAEIDIHNPYSLLSSLWLLEEQLDMLAGDRPIISDNHPSVEFYLSFPTAIQGEQLEKIIFNRSPFDKTLKRIANIKYEDQNKLKTHYLAMGHYQRGVAYNNSSLLLESVRMVEDNNLYRYHLQGERSQIARLKEKVASEPSDIETLINLGHAHFQIGEYEESLKYLKEVKKKSPNETLADLYIAYNKIKLHKFHEAKRLLKAIGKNSPKLLGSLFQDIALTELLTKLESKPDDVGLLLAAAEFYNRRQNYGESLEFSLKVLETDRMNAKALRSIIISYRGRGEANEAMAYGVQLETVEPDDLQLKYIMAELFVKTLRCNKAEPYLRDIIREDDTYPNAEKLMRQCNLPLDSPRKLS